MPFSGHLNPMTALARKLQSRGNEVVFFGVPDVEPFASAAGLDFVPYGEAEYPVGSIDRVCSSVATMRGFEVVRHSCMDLNPDLTRVAFDYLAEKLTTTGVEALEIDRTERCAGGPAEHLPGQAPSTWMISRADFRSNSRLHENSPSLSLAVRKSTVRTQMRSGATSTPKLQSRFDERAEGCYFQGECAQARRRH